MNVFYLDTDPETCAQMHIDKHVVKMCVEYAQLMSTAHRLIDGTMETDQRSLNGRVRKIKVWKLSDERESTLMKVSHYNHPSAVWVRSSDQNYMWLFTMWKFLLDEYTYRYDKIHGCAKYLDALSRLPKGIPKGTFDEPALAMPEHFKENGDSVRSYRNFYIGSKVDFATWKRRSPPDWFPSAI
jgi:hypothetical protein